MANTFYIKIFLLHFFLAMHFLCLQAITVATIHHEGGETVKQIDCQARLNQIEERMKQLDKQVGTLHDRNNVQEEEIVNIKRALEDLVFLKTNKPSNRSTRAVEPLAKQNKASNKGRSVQPVVESAKPPEVSSWSKLQISPDELGSMPYGDYGINIYGHSVNNLPSTSNETKRFFYAPISALNHGSAQSSFNNITEQAEVRFRVEMWNAQIEKEVLIYTANLVRHPVLQEQVRVLPLEKVMLSSRMPSKLYQLPNQWIDYQRHRSLTFTLTCKRLKDCDQVAAQMKSNPHQFHHLRLHFSLSSQTSERQETTIRIENIVNGDMMTKLNQRYPLAKEVLLTADDEKNLITESLTNVIVDSFDDSTVVSTSSQQMIYNHLENLLVSSRVTIKDQTDQMWSSVFWNDDNYRPDRSAKTLNDIHRNLDKENQDRLETSLSEENSIGGSIGIGTFGFSAEASFDMANSNATTYSKEGLDKLVQASKDTVEWDGEKFVPKPMTLSRINLAKVRDKQSFQNKNVRVSYTTAMLSVSVNINQQEKFVNEIFEINTKLQDMRKELSAMNRKPNCFRGEMPKSCQDLRCLGYKLNGFYMVKGAKSTKIETVYCDFSKTYAVSNSGKANISYAAIDFEKRIGYIDHKSSSVYFYVGKNMAFERNNAVLPFELERLNIGGAMNLTSGTFTAPVNGTYHFAFSGFKNDKGYIAVSIRLNGNTVGCTSSGHHDACITLSLHSTLRLRTGDRVELTTDYKDGGLLYDDDDHQTHFSGWLLEEDLSI